MSSGHGQSSFETFDDKASAAINSFSAPIRKTEKKCMLFSKTIFPKVFAEQKDTFENIA